MIAHNVYFTLIDNSEAAVQTLLAACRKYLVDHPGIVSFACGTLAVDHVREVNGPRLGCRAAHRFHR